MLRLVLMSISLILLHVIFGYGNVPVYAVELPRTQTH